MSTFALRSLAALAAAFVLHGVQAQDAPAPAAPSGGGLGDWLKQRFTGWRAYVLTGDARLSKLIGLTPSKRIPLFNGALECRLYEFVIVQGGARRRLTRPNQA